MKFMTSTLPKTSPMPERTAEATPYYGHLITSCLLAVVAALALPPTVTAGDFVCDINSLNGSIDNGFGAELPAGRELSSIPLPYPAECLSEGVTTVNGVIADLTRTGSGSTAMPVVPQIRLSSMTGPPTDILVTGPEVVVQGIPIFPNFARAPIPTPPVEIALDRDRDGTVDLFIGSGLILTSTSNQNQFVGYTRSGPPVPCFTTIVGQPLKEPCSNGDPLFKSLGQGLQISAAKARVGDDSTYCPFDIRTNNPGVSIGATFEMKLQLAAGSSCVSPTHLDVVDILSDKTGLLRRFEDVEPGTVLGFAATPDEVETWRNGRMWVVVTEGLFTDLDRVVPAHGIFLDGFESGSTVDWSQSVP